MVGASRIHRIGLVYGQRFTALNGFLAPTYFLYAATQFSAISFCASFNVIEGCFPHIGSSTPGYLGAPVAAARCGSAQCILDNCAKGLTPALASASASRGKSAGSEMFA
jgi:hypothetical protein